jgi:hypothetical protein
MGDKEFTMAIESKDGTTAITGEHIGAFRLLTIRQGLKAEARGMRLTRNAPSCLSIVKKEFGLKGNLASVTVQFDDLLRANGIIA